MINGVIGSGIFGLPSRIAALTGRQSPLVFLIAAAGIAVIAGCFAELASRFSESGGPYLYARAAFGRFAGIQTGWLNALSRVASTAANANLFTLYLAEFWPRAERHTVVVTTILLLVFAVFNVRGVKTGARTNNFLTASKLLPLLLFVVLGLVFLSTRATPSFNAHESHETSAWLNGMLLAIVAYVGFEGALIPAGETKNPQRDAPIAILTALAICAPIYVFAQLVVVQTLPDPAHSQRPLLAAAHIFGGVSLAAVVGIGVLLSVIGFLAGSMIASPRILFALAEQQDFPRCFSTIHPRYRTPYISIIAFAAAVWILAMLGNFTWNARLTAVSRLVTYTLSCAALPVLRRKSSETAKFRLPGGDLLAFLGIAFCGLLITQIGKAEILILVPTLMLGSVNWLIVTQRSTQQSTKTRSAMVPTVELRKVT